MYKFNAEQIQLIEENSIAFSTVDKQGKPNTIVVACIKVVEESKVLITDNFMLKTKKNLEANNNVSLAVWDNTGNHALQIKGTALYLTEGKYKEMVDIMPENEGLAHKAAILVEVTEVWDLAMPKLIFRSQ